MTTGMNRILAERKRQIEVEGYNADHDKSHTPDVLVSAAACYFSAYEPDAPTPLRWPWEVDFWKPKDRIRNLERAGALYLAAADRAERLGQHDKAELHRQAAELMGISIDDAIEQEAKRAEIEAVAQAEKHLDDLFYGTYPANSPVILDWVRIKFMLKQIRNNPITGFSCSANTTSDTRAKAPKIYWRYRYIEKGREVEAGEDMVLTPDHLGRWQIEGSIKIPVGILSGNNNSDGFALLPVAWINQRGCNPGDVPSIDPADRFACKFPCFSASAHLGFGEMYLYGKTPNEVMGKVQAALERAVFIFINSCAER